MAKCVGFGSTLYTLRDIVVWWRACNQGSRKYFPIQPPFPLRMRALVGSFFPYRACATAPAFRAHFPPPIGIIEIRNFRRTFASQSNFWAQV
ncbi:hypothetical protein E2320_013899 [Naja naja]|nr:hypothetical protein E2320_013899 [Naja naja]